MYKLGLELLFHRFMASQAKIGALLNDQLCIGRAVRIVASRTRAVLHRCVYERSLLERLDEIHMAFEACLPYRTIEKTFAICFMRVMTLGAGPYGHRPMLIFLRECGGFVTVVT